MARPFFRRRKSCPFSGEGAPVIDYKDVKLLQRYVSERGKILGKWQQCSLCLLAGDSLPVNFRFRRRFRRGLRLARRRFLGDLLQFSIA